MASEKRLSGALQENVLTLLCFDEEAAKIIRNSIEIEVFESSIYRDIASHAIDFLDLFGTAIGEHLPDSLETVLKGDDRAKARIYEKTLSNLYQAKDEVHSDYVISQLNGFVRQQNLKGGLTEAVKLVKEGKVEEAETVLNTVLNRRISSFDPGQFFIANSQRDILSFMDSINQSIPLGIHALDKYGIGPVKKEMLLFIAPAKRGKSWALIHCGKYSLIHRQKVCHITLEMSEDRVKQRYIQSFFSITKRESEIEYPIFEVDSRGIMSSIDFTEVERPTFNDDGIRSYILDKMKKLRMFTTPRLVIKEFPTGTLTVSALKAYLDTLEHLHKFVPDVLIIDYPDLMRIDGANLRIDTGSIFKNLRGIGVEREMAMVVATQGNRSSADAKLVTDSHVAEDYSKIATADNVITYSQTPSEKKLGLARLYVSNGRNENDKFTVLISQSYTMGQFCLDSALINNEYFKSVEDLATDFEGSESEESS